MSALSADARAVLLPIDESLLLEPWLVDYLARGGRTVLLASSGAEYAARQISSRRRAVERPETVLAFGKAATKFAKAPVLLAVDAEPTGVQRLEHLLPVLPGRTEIARITREDLTKTFQRYASAARELGIGMFLGPVVDEIRGENVWLEGRILADNLQAITAIADLYVAEVQRAGIVATAKHFPGHSHLDAHPVHSAVSLQVSTDELEQNLLPFRKLVASGVQAIMVGPVVVEAIDPDSPAANSARVIELLRNGLGFGGLIVSDDLDAKATMKTDPLGEVAIRSVEAGVQLLLIPGGDAVTEVADALEQAVVSGRLPAERLRDAADKVRALATSSPAHASA
jgi:beta-N-acetylhexosaminidase